MAALHTVPRARGGADLKNTGHERTTIDRILEFAVTLNSKDLTQPDEATSIQVEYRTGLHHSLEYLKLGSSTKRGYWHLIGEYWMHSSTGHQAERLSAAATTQPVSPSCSMQSCNTRKHSFHFV
jgi:hypothetical protein